MTRLAAALLAAALAAPAGARDAPAVERFHPPGPGSVNTWLIEGPDGLVVIDGQRTLSAGREAAALIGDRPVAAILLTHPHPDHVTGLAALIGATGAPLHASAAAAQEMRADTRGLLALTRQGAPEEFPEALPEPDVIVAEGETLSLGGLTVEVGEFGPSEAATMTTYHLPGAGMLFPGDLIDSGATPFLLEKCTEEWLAQLEAIAAAYPPDTTVHPGHGPAGRLGDLLPAQVDYIEGFRARVAEAVEDGESSGDEAAAIAAETEALHPDHEPVAALPDPPLTERNARAVAAEMLGDPGAPPVATIGD